MTTKPRKSTDITPNMFRLREGLTEKLRQAAKDNQQSLNAEVASRLEASFDEDNHARVMATIAGSGQNAALLSSVAMALYLTNGAARRNDSIATKMKIFAEAVSVIARAHGGEKFTPVTDEELAAMDRIKGDALLVADSVLAAQYLERDGDPADNGHRLIKWPADDPLRRLMNMDTPES